MITKIGCHFTRILLSCQQCFQGAFYRCPHESIIDVECSTGESGESRIIEECNCKSNCQIRASNRVFGDPCL